MVNGYDGELNAPTMPNDMKAGVWKTATKPKLCTEKFAGIAPDHTLEGTTATLPDPSQPSLLNLWLRLCWEKSTVFTVRVFMCVFIYGGVL